MENQTDNKVLGIPAPKYTNLCYMLLLVSSGVGLLSNLLAFIGVYIPGGSIFGLIGLAGLILSLLGLFVFKDKFSSLDVTHFKYIGLLFVAFFIISMILVTSLGGWGVIGLLVILLLSTAQFVLFLAGYRTYKAGVDATKQSITSNIKSGFKA